MRSREALANRLLCATINAVEQRRLSFATTTDLIGGDGIFMTKRRAKYFQLNMRWWHARRVPRTRKP